MAADTTANAVTVQPRHAEALTHDTIQRTVDACAANGGGTVRVPAGTYAMRGPVQLRTGVHLVGDAGAVLRKAPSVSSPLAHVTGYGFYEFTPTQPAHFDIGMGVHLRSDETRGFLETVAVITARAGDTFFLDRPANMDCRVQNGATAATVHPLIEAIDVRDASVSGLTLDGSAEQNAMLNGCRGGGVFLLRAQRIHVEDCEVAAFNGDGVSFQQCTDVFVCRCHIHDCWNCGLHPGSGSVRYVLAGNEVHDNGAFGLFYCLRTTHGRAEGNVLYRNGKAGVSIGEMDTDHVVARNSIHHNAGPAIAFREPVTAGGDRVRIERNTFEANDGDAEVWIPAGLYDIAVLANTWQSDSRRLMQVGEHGARLYAADNTIGGRAQTRDDVMDPAGLVRFERPASFVTVGPDALAPDGARHLGIDELPAWLE